MLTRIRLENFKSWRELDIELAPLTLLFGTNSSGKSSVLQALLMLKQTANSFDRGQHINFGGGERDYVDLGSYRDVIFRHDKSLQAIVDVEWLSFVKSPLLIFFLSLHRDEIETYRRRCIISWVEQNDETVINRLEYKAFKDNDLVAFWQSYLQPNNTYQTLLKTTDFSHDIDRPSDEGPIALNIPYFREVFRDISQEIDYLGPSRNNPQRAYLWTGATPQMIGLRGENTIAALVASERKQGDLLSQVSEWLARMGVVKELKIEALDRDKRFYETVVKINDGDAGSSILDVGFGVSQVLPVITMLFFVPEGSIVLLEQPELHLHPSAQAHLGDLLLHVAETRNLQLIVESHSEHLLRRIQRRIAETEYPFATPENIKAYFCQPGADGSKIEQVVVDKYGQIHNWPDNFFGDVLGDLDALTDAALARRREELMREQNP